jgi:hypothetical protein
MKTSTAKNDTPNKFWASVEPYCAHFTDDDLKVKLFNKTTGSFYIVIIDL